MNPTSCLSKTFAIVGFLFLVVAVAFLVPDRQWISALCFVAAAFFFVVGWNVGTEQLTYAPVLGKIGVLMLSISIMTLTIAAVSSIYSEVGGCIHDISVSQYILWIDRYRPRLRHSMITEPAVEMLHVHPYASISSSLLTFGAFLLFGGLFLKYRYDYVVDIKHQLTHQKHFAFGFFLLSVGMILLLFSSICRSYTDAYTDFLSGEVDVPSAYSYTELSTQKTYLGECLPLYIDFVFAPWFDCYFETWISSCSANNVTLLVFVEDMNEPIVNTTSNEIRYSRNIQANTPYTYRIRNTQNHTVTVLMSTKIDEFMSETTMRIGSVLAATGFITAISLTRRQLKHDTLVCNSFPSRQIREKDRFAN